MLRSPVPSILSATLLALALLHAAPVHAQSASASASADAAPEIPLPELPTLQAIEKPAVDAEASKDLESRLSQLADMTTDDPLGEADLRVLTADPHPHTVGAVAQRLIELKGRLDGDAAERQLEKARRRGRDAIKSWLKKNKKKKKSEAPDGDWLVFLLSLDKRGDTWRDTTELIALLRMLEHDGSTAAVREMITSYSYFGELVRIDLQRALERLGDKAVPALLEATKHDAKKVRGWARRQLDSLGKVTPGEIVSTTDPQILADALRALGRVRDVEATRVILSFANADRIELRQAAREAVAAMGEPAEWQIKDTYKSIIGKAPPKSWDWSRTAREIFRLHDRARLSKVYDLWDEGKAALAAKRYPDATAAFDKVLARVPLFDQRAEMAPAYVGHADALAAEGKHDEALLMLRKALRLVPEDAQQPTIEAKVMVLEARELQEKGTPDRSLLERALKLDPDNADAKALLASLEADAEQRQSHTMRYLGAGGLLLLGLLIAIFTVGWPRRRAAPQTATAEDEQGGAGTPQ